MTPRSRIRKPNPIGRKLLLEALEDRRLLTATRLDDPQAAVGTIEDYEISPDGQFGVYVADGEVDGVQELYSVRFSSGAATKLSGPLVDGGDVVDFQISPDSGHVVYRADQDSNEVFELYSVAISGGDPIKLNGPLVDGATSRAGAAHTRLMNLAIKLVRTAIELPTTRTRIRTRCSTCTVFR